MPSDFDWYFYESFGQHHLRIGQQIVAMVTKRVPGDWGVSVNRQRGLEYMNPYGRAKTYTIACKFAERWAITNQDRLRAELAWKADPANRSPLVSKRGRR